MKFLHLLPLVALSSAFVIPDEETAQSLVLEADKPSGSVFDKLPSKQELASGVSEFVYDVEKKAHSKLDDAIALFNKAGKKAKGKFRCNKYMTAFDGDAWLDTTFDKVDFGDNFGLPKEQRRSDLSTLGHGHKHPNKTVYELIANSKYTTILAKIISEDDKLVDILNGTKANYTVFAPINKAFKKLHHHHGGKKPSKELIRKAILYHVLPEFYPAGRVLVSKTAPTALKVDSLGGEPQRVRFNIGLNGLTVNFYSRIIAIDIFGTNGVIHGVDSLIFLPPPALKILSILPGQFSTLELGLLKTGLAEGFEKFPHIGGTLFAPSNWAFQKLGPKANAFLFSSYGKPYLKALLEYHLSANETVYSDYYKPSSSSSTIEDIPKGFVHIELQTLLKDHKLSIDIGRWARFISFKINGFYDVAISDGIAADGVVHLLDNVLIPPKTPGAAETEDWAGKEVSVDVLKERLGPYVKRSCHGMQEDAEESRLDL